MIHASRLIAPTLASLILVSGCARDTGSYPSLAPRAVEKLSFAEPDRAPVAAAPDPTLARNVAEDRTMLARVTKAFDTAAAGAERATQAAGARTIGGDAWLAAQTALGVVDTARSDLSALVTAIDRQIADRVAAGTPIDASLSAVRDDAAAEAARQDAAITALDERVPKG